MRWPVLLLLLTLALGGCTIDVVPGARAEPSAGQGAGGAGTADRNPDTDVDARPAADETRGGDEDTAVRVVDAFWQTWFDEQGRRYVSPRVEGGYTGRDGPSCGGEASVPGNAYYCPPGNFLAWDEDLMRAGYTQIGDAWVYLVIAHEWGHAIQAQLPDRYVSPAVELQADCLAGAGLQGAADQGLIRIEPGDDEEIARTLEAVADDYPWTDQQSHGDARQRVAAFRTGASGGVDGCLSS